MPRRLEKTLMEKIHATTILAVIHNDQVAIGGDGQATMGNYVAKSNVRKIRKLSDGKVLAGFAGDGKQKNSGCYTPICHCRHIQKKG